MSIKHQESSIASIGQSPGCDPKTSKRSSGLFSFFKWFKPSVSRESVTHEVSSSSSCDSLNSISSTGTIASFSFVPASDYKIDVTQKNIAPGPETDTYRARLKQRDKRREHDKDLTLRKKYNLFFNRDTVLKATPTFSEESDNSKSLPLMTRKTENDEEKLHRRTNSESSKIKKAGAYCHVKGKRKAPAPPGIKTIDGNSSMSLRRKKRLAPQPPATVTSDKIITSFYGGGKYDTIEYADADVIFNDCLKLDHGILKSTKNTERDNVNNASSKSPRSSYMEAPVSPRPWYKRNLSRESGVIAKKDKDEKYEPLERLPDVQYSRISSITDLTVEDPKVNKKKEDKRKSGIAFLTNISELDREACEIIKKEHQSDNKEAEIPQFMRPKQEQNKNTDSWMSPKRKSARDLIAKFNAITNVTKVTVNTSFFGARESGAVPKENFKREYFGKIGNEQTKEIKIEAVNKQEEKNKEKRVSEKIPLTKSESSVIKYKESSKLDKKSWYCPKCSLENDYWRIICYVCSTIKPYFDDLTTPPTKINSNTFEKNKTENSEIKHFPPSTSSDASKNTPAFNFVNGGIFERNLERSKTQIGFSALAKYNENKDKNRKFVKSVSSEDKPIQNKSVDKQGEKERLKKMLIEMKNSLPKRKHNFLEKQQNRTSIIQENVETEIDKKIVEEKPCEKIAEVTIVTQETVYENIKVKKTDNPKPIKITASAQTSTVTEKQPLGAIQKQEINKKFELMRPKDFANIYNVKTDKPNQHIYSNLLENKDLFLNMPVKFNEIKNSLGNSTDTLEINRLLKRLETSIARGELSEASNFARELAQLKVNCSVIRQKSVESQQVPNLKPGFAVDMYVEDKVSHRGPFQINVSEDQTVAELKLQVENEFQIPVVVQRWILGKELATDDNALLRDLNVTTGCSIFLYLVAPTNDQKADREKSETKVAETTKTRPLEDLPLEVEIETPTNIYANEENVNAGGKEPLANIKNDNINAINGDVQLEIATNIITKSENYEDVEDYDSHTLKPQNSKTWECMMCTFLNEQSNNICAICSTVRKIDSAQGKSTYTRNKRKAPQPTAQKEQHYLQLLNLDNADLVENVEPFDCLICLTEINSHEGVTLRECLHQFCKICLAHTIEFTDEAEVKCPYRDSEYSCDISLQDREIKALVSLEVYEQFLAKSVAQAENRIDKSFHCKTPDCKGWCIFEDNVNEFHCPVCRRNNCLTCQVIHIGLNCREYQEEINESVTDEGTKRTKEMLEELVNKGEAIKCPTCHVILMKKWGCDWLRCSMCKTEICWVTRGPRWGPAGKGDTSGGCQCGVNGMKCHPQCNYCH
ncbi:hypothetical protein RI129_004467 [Pyrocoelia pectoralis]|uniref:RanBP-type and C3HC4-type zinc finger-containing protein 1 n=1 Tax=Pyrocoelia pectoralis TaxID=417401 RepID=A0AAN7VGZ4_9COLE